MFPAFVGGFLGASLATHSGVAGIVSAIFYGIVGLMVLLFVVMLLWFLVVAVVYYVVIPVVRCGLAVVAVPFALMTWTMDRLSRSTVAGADEPLWRRLRGLFSGEDQPSAFRRMSPGERCEWVNRYGRDV